ncbi:MAG TPA: YceI family protein [Gammaproteobacteria bacterium]
MKKLLASLLLLTAFVAPLHAENYVIDTKNAHAFIEFRIQHLGYSWLLGRFNDFDGSFSYDEKNPATSKVTVNIRPASVDTNHAERDKHLRSKDFLLVDKFPSAKFVSTSYEAKEGNKGILKGNLTLRGITKPVVIDVTQVGAGPDPWGGFRRGFSGTTTLTLKDFGIDFDLGPSARSVELFLSVEGVRQ